MAINFLKVRNGITVKPVTAPGTPENGDIYYDSGSNLFQFYQNGTLITIPTTYAASIGSIDGQSAVANGLQIVSNVLYAQSASASFPGMVNITGQTFAGSKVFASAPAITDTSAAHNVILSAASSVALTADRTLTIDTTNVSSTLKMGANLTVTATASISGTNSGDITLAAVGASPSANAATLSGQQLTLQPFDSTHPGVVTASGGGTTNFLRADGTWAAATGATTNALGSGGVVTKSGAYVIVSGDNGKIFWADSTSAAFNFTLPTASSGFIFTIKDSKGQFGTNNVTLVRAASESIEGVAASFVMSANWGSWTFSSDGTNWTIVAH